VGVLDAFRSGHCAVRVEGSRVSLFVALSRCGSSAKTHATERQ
jgi:hypothetical protein